jgi:hypothetical protein
MIIVLIGVVFKLIIGKIIENIKGVGIMAWMRRGWADERTFRKILFY